ncbi:MAG: prepilin-type N-terminal cleavage/methylation domain-containing protein, partial [Candidatus Cloacimonetes bacterium]|nr:prepilin-type N-terminal cleavage/methylation domain-containing protein [Candidatus Cloacimonadota bacterium]
MRKSSIIVSMIKKRLMSSGSFHSIIYNPKSKIYPKGFTIIELLVVIVVIGILATFTIVQFVGMNNKAIAASLKTDLKNNVNLLKLYHVENDVYPSEIDNNSKCPIAPFPDARYCLKASSNSALTYTGADQHFTMTNTKNGMTYMVSEGNEEPSLVTLIESIANISGTTQITKTLTAGALTPSDATVSYQWQSATTSNGTYTNISGATSSTYTLTSNELDKYIKVVATGTNSYYGTVTSNASAQVTKIPLTAIANITGTTQVGQTLTAGARTPAAATVSYQWQSATTSNGTYTNISGATSSTYTLTSNEVSKYIKVVATGTGNYSGSATSAASAQVAKIPLTAIAAITGTTQNGQTLTAGALTPSGATASYQWQSATTSGGTYTNISGATSSTYVLVFGNVGKYIKVVATGTG